MRVCCTLCWRPDKWHFLRYWCVLFVLVCALLACYGLLFRTGVCFDICSVRMPCFELLCVARCSIVTRHQVSWRVFWNVIPCVSIATQLGVTLCLPCLSALLWEDWRHSNSCPWRSNTVTRCSRYSIEGTHQLWLWGTCLLQKMVEVTPCSAYERRCTVNYGTDRVFPCHSCCAVGFYFL